MDSLELPPFIFQKIKSLFIFSMKCTFEQVKDYSKNKKTVENSKSFEKKKMCKN